MEEKILITEKTKLQDILEAYPWLPEELIRLDRRFEKLNSPLVRILIRRADVADAGRYTGFSAQEIIAHLAAVVAAHEER